MSLWEYILSFLALAIGGGFLAGLLGMGGGVVLVPFLILLFERSGVSPELAPHMAVGTALALAAPAAAWGTWKEHSVGLLNTRFLRTWAPSLILGVVVALIFHKLVSGIVLRILYTVFIFWTGIYIGFLRDRIRFESSWPSGWKKWGSAFVIGVVSALIGVAGGVFAGPFLSSFAIHLQQALAMALATSGIIGFSGGLGNIVVGWGIPGLSRFAIGYVDWVVFLTMLVPMALFSYLGTTLRTKLSPHELKVGYSSFLFLMALYMLGTVVKIW